MAERCYRLHAHLQHASASLNKRRTLLNVETSVGTSVEFSSANTNILLFWYLACEKAVSVKMFLASPRSEPCRIFSFCLAEYGLLCTNSVNKS